MKSVEKVINNHNVESNIVALEVFVLSIFITIKVIVLYGQR